jgi:hypothetical protein
VPPSPNERSSVPFSARRVIEAPVGPDPAITILPSRAVAIAVVGSVEAAALVTNCGSGRPFPSRRATNP